MSRERNVASRAQQRLLAGLSGLAVMVLVSLYVIRPMQARERQIRATLGKRLEGNDLARTRIRKMPEIEQHANRLAETLGAEPNRFVLRPVLGSFPVQRDIYRLAAETGFSVALVRELGKTPTPTEIRSRAAAERSAPVAADKPPPSKTPPPALARYLVEVSGEGSYACLVALLERLEQENPYCGVNALAIRGLPNVPTRHRVTLTLEWPVVADPPAAKGGKR